MTLIRTYLYLSVDLFTHMYGYETIQLTGKLWFACLVLTMRKFQSTEMPYKFSRKVIHYDVIRIQFVQFTLAFVLFSINKLNTQID